MTASAAPTYSIVTTCKGRLDDLKQSLPRFVAQHDAEVIVVDYDCPQGTAAFVRGEYPTVKVVAVADRPLFDMPDARNRGAAQATGGVLVFLDADVIVTPDFLRLARFPADAKAFAVFPGGKSNSLRGSCLVRREDFDAVDGYDDLLSGYESEDLDLYMRLRLLGARRIFLDENSVETVVEQSLDERLRYRPPVDLTRQFLRGQLYQLAKEAVMRARGVVRLAPSLRQRLMAQVDRQLDAVFTGEKDFELTINLPDRYERGMLSQWEFSTAVTVRAHKKAVK
jgi:glycosyltransferase involved in cell wall biosynthesis